MSTVQEEDRSPVLETGLAAQPSRTAPKPPLWTVTGQIPRARVSLLYRAGLVLVATAMVLLPLLYLSMIAGLVYCGRWYALAGGNVFLSSRNLWVILIGYAGPLIAAAAILFMLKPLFSRREKPPANIRLIREGEPRLFALIDEVCALVGAPRPARVHLDSRVNASASFVNNWSLITGKLQLTIGMPLIRGLTVEEFAGVLAHEFGHFSQGGAMRCTYIIYKINAWFHRVAFVRDAWDEQLSAALRSGGDARIKVLLAITASLIWLTRRILVGFMYAGHAISCFMMRQMEFDADYYGAQVGGSASFEKTSHRLRLLNLANGGAISKLRTMWEQGRLVDDLPKYIDLESKRIPDEIKRRLDQAIGEAKTKWFDTHPGDDDRIRKTAALRANGVLRGDSPAELLFDGVEAMSKAVTQSFYTHDCHLNLGSTELVAVEELLVEAQGDRELNKALREFFNEVVTPDFPYTVSLDTVSLPPELPRIQLISNEARQQQQATAVVPLEVRNGFQLASNVISLTGQGALLVEAGITISASEYKLPSATPEGAELGKAQAEQRMEATLAKLEPYIRATNTRLRAGLQALWQKEGGDMGRLAEAVELIRLVELFQAHKSALLQLRRNCLIFSGLLQSKARKLHRVKVEEILETLGGCLEREQLAIQTAFAKVNYPLPGFIGTVGEYLTAPASGTMKLVEPFTRAQALFDRAYELYVKAIGQLAFRCMTAEREVLW